MKKSEFLEKVELFLEKTGMSATNLGKKAKGDPKFVFNLRNGTEIREETQEKVLAFMDRYAVEKGIEWAGVKS